jgi:IS30 family transposase
VKNLTKDTFESIKQLQEHGLSNRQMAKITNFSLATIDRAKKQETWADYVKYKKDYNVKRRGQIAQKQTKAYTWIQSVVDEKKEPAKAVISDYHLSRIANALERLADAWEKQPSKKGWLK